LPIIGFASHVWEQTEKETPSTEKISLETGNASKSIVEEVKNDMQEEVNEKEGSEETNEAAETVADANNQIASTKGQAYITFEEESYFFGEIEEGDIVKHTFKFKNDGKGTLIIKDATATCGCTRPDFPFVPIQPGETGDINVVFNSTGKVGPQKKAVTVYSNGQPRVKKVFLEGTVLAKKEKVETENADLEADTTAN